ncbi:MAG: response regulator transcription factor [Oscillospiraceae bacterium]|nr:response regulator transcription factor [Oscillospiraceae bacterium]
MQDKLIENNQNIVIIGNDIRFARMLELELKNNGYACKKFYIPDGGSDTDGIGNTGRHLCADALNYCFENNCSFAILAIGEIGSSYMEFMKLSKKSAINIVFTSFENVINDFKKKITGKEYNKYSKNNIVFVKRPFITEQFIKEVAAFQKKINKMKTAQPKTIQIGDLLIDENTKSVTFKEDKIELTKKEYDLLIFLIKNRGEVVDRKRIFVEVWGFDYYGSTNVVDVFVRYLRNKIDQKYKVKLIHTVRGMGYTIRK